jgi:hypothetical protein
MHQTIVKKYRIPFIFANQAGGNDSVLFDGTRPWSSLSENSFLTI